MLCYAMLCYAMLCYAMRCYAMLCDAMRCYAMLCDAMLGATHSFRGNYSAWLTHKAERLRLQELANEARAKRMQSEPEWIRTKPKGGRTTDKARVRSNDHLSVAAGEAQHGTATHTPAHRNAG